MKLLLDENLPVSLVTELKLLGFEVIHVITERLRGSSDIEITAYAKKQNAILITKDLELGSVLLYPPNTHCGLIILRLPYNYNTKQIADIIKIFLKQIQKQELIGKMYVVEVGKYRVRKI